MANDQILEEMTHNYLGAVYRLQEIAKLHSELGGSLTN